MLRFVRGMLVASAVVATVALIAWGASGGALDDDPAPATIVLESAPSTDAAREALLELLPMPPAGQEAAVAAPALPAPDGEAARHLSDHGDGVCPLGPGVI